MQTLLNKRQRKPKGNKNGKYRETGNIGNKKTATKKKKKNKQNEKTKKKPFQKHNTICVGHHCAQTNTTKVNKT